MQSLQMGCGQADCGDTPRSDTQERSFMRTGLQLPSPGGEISGIALICSKEAETQCLTAWKTGTWKEGEMETLGLW